MLFCSVIGDLVVEGFAEKVQQTGTEQDDVIHDAAAGTVEGREEKSSAGFYDVVKRAQDIVLSLLALILLSPVLLLICLLIVIDDPKGGPIFTQIRCGKGNSRFRFYKFRTMVVNAEEVKEQLRKDNEMDGPVFKIKDDPRITRVGRILRRTSLDELPQLVNIIRGDMSIVGPRPPVPDEVEKYTKRQMQRLSVIPGLTCYWQTHPNRYNLSFDEWVEMDLKYIEERNLGLDWKLIVRTVKTVLMGHGE